MGIMTEKEEAEFKELRYGFNKIPENKEYTIMNGTRIEVSKYWTRKLLAYSLYLNIISIILFSITLVIAALKPYPNYYATTPDGQLYPLKTITINEKR